MGAETEEVQEEQRLLKAETWGSKAPGTKYLTFPLVAQDSPLRCGGLARRPREALHLASRAPPAWGSQEQQLSPPGPAPPLCGSQRQGGSACRGLCLFPTLAAPCSVTVSRAS